MSVRPNDGWYSFDDIIAARGCGPSGARTLRRDLAAVSPAAIRREPDPGRPGRPRKLYHYTALPDLVAAHGLRSVAPDPVADPEPAGGTIAPDDLALARLRLKVVLEYQALAKSLPRSLAAKSLSQKIARKPLHDTVHVDERLPGGHIRKAARAAVIARACPSTIREWERLYKVSGLPGLAPARKERTGAPRKEIPPELLDFVHALSVSTERADVTKALTLARQKWPGEFPKASVRTWQRRISERDPEGVCETLGKLGTSAYQKDHSPDCDRDYSGMRLNQLWQLDDITEDFYGHSSDARKLIRPYVYAVIRVPSRRWICGVACETPIVQDKVRSLLGLAFASDSGGIPEEITFERGAIACDDYLAGLLADLGVKVHRTSMDGGQTHPAALPDRGIGHFQGKGVIESNIRLHHEHAWTMPGGTGPDERSTAKQNLETLKAEALRRKANGEFLLLPTPEQWSASIYQAFETHNERPHGSLPEIVDPDTAAIRRMTPNEFEQHRKTEPFRVMDQRLLPLFFRRGLSVPVTKNGFRMNDTWYGRFDPDLEPFAGRRVMAYALKDLPDAAYVVELGRCVDRFSAEPYGTEDGNIGRKRSADKRKRSKYEDLISRAMSQEGPITIESVKFMRNPIPARARESVCPDPLLARAREIAAGGDRLREERRKRDARFDAVGAPEAKPARGRGILARTGDYADQLAVLAPASSQQQQEEDKWKL